MKKSGKFLPPLKRYVSVPHAIALDWNVNAASKLLFGLLYDLSMTHGYTTVGDTYLANSLGFEESIVSLCLEELKICKYISISKGPQREREIWINRSAVWTWNLWR